MKYAVIGGDKRSVFLCSLLSEDGHKVQSFALEKGTLPPSVSRVGCLQACVYGADCVVLPCPAERAGLLRCPLSDHVLPLEAVLSALWPGQAVFGGQFSQESQAQAMRLQLSLHDLLRREDYAAGNAAISAEGAVGLLLKNSERTAAGAQVLVCGWGRIGKLLSLRLAALGAHVTVAARSPKDRAMAAAMGFPALPYEGLEAAAGSFDWVVNTVPARVLTDPMLCMMCEGTLLLELASPPGGFDARLAQNIGLKTVSALGLPGKSAPLSAAMLLQKVIYAIISEQEEQE